MPIFKLPLSGDVRQTIAPWSGWFSGGTYGLVNINLGLSGEPKIEAEVLSDVAGYGRQLGRMGDVLAVLMDRLPQDDLSEPEAKAVADLRKMLARIAKVRAKHNRPAPPALAVGQSQV